jgi:5-methyltetrahydrofolate--homocysteine methyltransferase
MVSCEKILAAAKEQNADLIGLSGLITPSLDEMVHVAGEMQRLGYQQPLLIGGATTSPAHTAVKIDPRYRGPVIYVKDASRAVGVCQQLVTPATRDAYVGRIKLENATRREQHAGRSTKAPQLSLAEARADRARFDWATQPPPVPRMLGVRAFDDWSIEELTRYIDWTPFFQAWELHGRFPDILTDKVVGEQASKLYDDARHMLRTVIRERWLRARAVFGLFAANSSADDVIVYADEARGEPLQVLNFLRQQKDLPKGMAHAALADYIAPSGSGVNDYLGAFAVTTGIGIETQIAKFTAAHDDYSSIMLKVLADRLAEALAERLHERVRREFWGYASDEKLGNEQLIREEYRGIRPAPGYPSCPDHTEKSKLFALLDAHHQAGITLTESYAMHPAAAVCGWYFSHPEARYINLGKVGRDQVADYAHRKGMTLAEMERWLAPNLGYEPGDMAAVAAAAGTA